VSEQNELATGFCPLLMRWIRVVSGADC